MFTTLAHATTAFPLGTLLCVDDGEDDDTDGTEALLVLGLAFPTGADALTSVGFTGSVEQSFLPIQPKAII